MSLPSWLFLQSTLLNCEMLSSTYPSKSGRKALRGGTVPQASKGLKALPGRRDHKVYPASKVKSGRAAPGVQKATKATEEMRVLLARTAPQAKHPTMSGRARSSVFAMPTASGAARLICEGPTAKTPSSWVAVRHPVAQVSTRAGYPARTPMCLRSSSSNNPISGSARPTLKCKSGSQVLPGASQAPTSQPLSLLGQSPLAMW